MKPMSIEMTILVSIVSVSFAIYTGIKNLQRNKTSDDKAEATQLTTVIVKLESISSGVNEIKADMKNVKEDLVELRERVVKVEESTKSAHHRIDTLSMKEGEPS